MKETQDYFMKVDDDMYDNLSSYATRERCYVGLSHSDICLWSWLYHDENIIIDVSNAQRWLMCEKISW